MMMILHYRENNNFSSPLMSSKSRIYVTYNERILVEFIYILCFSSSSSFPLFDYRILQKNEIL